MWVPAAWVHKGRWGVASRQIGQAVCGVLKFFIFISYHREHLRLAESMHGCGWLGLGSACRTTSLTEYPACRPITESPSEQQRDRTSHRHQTCTPERTPAKAALPRFGVPLHTPAMAHVRPSAAASTEVQGRARAGLRQANTVAIGVMLGTPPAPLLLERIQAASHSRPEGCARLRGVSRRQQHRWEPRHSL